ncbi:hypothetical protein C7974DRAFT_419854 [Boeremia exigua]|uniref:uncharacterized protein n=1 Tax=Boeremia exigua TaxID=749465 RepID=UPI001E8CAC2B|nr:uncharacterized protein C7974DRAFT_419854 [Boeremia exigua]KAH6644357.1 hypothetical protein C7974DRAFT_419854 [Boeremia exigua]
MSMDLATDFPDLQNPPGFEGIRGILVVPLCLGGNEFMVFLRDAQPTLVKRASKRSILTLTSAANKAAEPICEKWSPDEIEVASILCLISEKANQIHRLQQRTTLHGDTMAQLLLSNAAHELCTQLNAVINYLELARDSLGPDIRSYLTRSQCELRTSASPSSV